MDDPYRVDAAPGTEAAWTPGAPVAAAWGALGLLVAGLLLVVPGMETAGDRVAVPAVGAFVLFLASAVKARRCLRPPRMPWTVGTRRLARLVLVAAVVAAAWMGAFLVLLAGMAWLNPRL